MITAIKAQMQDIKGYSAVQFTFKYTKKVCVLCLVFAVHVHVLCLQT